MFHMTAIEIVDTITDPMIDDCRDVFLSVAPIIETISARIRLHLERVATEDEQRALLGLLDESARLLRALGDGGTPLPRGAIDPRLDAIDHITARSRDTECVFYELYELTDHLDVSLRSRLDGFHKMWTVDERRAIAEMIGQASLRINYHLESA